MKRFFFFAVCLLSALSVLSCTPEERANLLSQITDSKTDSSSSGDDTPEIPVTTLSGSFAFDDGTGLSALYYTFLKGVMYKYSVSSPVVLAEGYMWHVSADDFALVDTGDYVVDGGVLYCKGKPYGSISITNKKMTLAGQNYTKIAGFMPQRYSEIQVDGGFNQNVSYAKQTIAISVNRPIPSGVIKVSTECDWLSAGELADGVLSLVVDENNTGESRIGSVLVSYPESEDVVLTVNQSYSAASLALNPGSQEVDNFGGEFSFDFTVTNPRQMARVTAESQVDWIMDVTLSGNTVCYKVSGSEIVRRTGTIILYYYYGYNPGSTIQYASSTFMVMQSQASSASVDPTAANCYIVSSPGTYSFKTVLGNTTASVGNVSTAEVLWESFGTSTAPSKGDIISSVSYAPGSGSSPGTITYTTPSPLKNGNAVIAAKDASGNILWSWHIWVCSGYNPVSSAQTYYNSAGVMMDRNLGATSATPGYVGSLGLLYQWGRKDPFLGSSSISSNSKAASTLSWPSPVFSDFSNGTINYAVKHPTTFISYNRGNYDWYYTGSNSTDDTRWQSGKTIFDPCPPGWRVPDGGSSGVWSTATDVHSWHFSYTWNSTFNGMFFSGKFGDASPIWYPAAAYLDCGDGSLNSVGTLGRWWSCTPNDYYAYYLNLSHYGLVSPSDSYYRAYGHSVRCQKE